MTVYDRALKLLHLGPDAADERGTGRWIRRVLLTSSAVALVVKLTLALVILLIPVRPLEGLQPAAALADPDSRFVTVNNLNVHLKQDGAGAPAVVLLHGFAASTFTWRDIQPPLSEHYATIAYDRPAFGLTERPDPREFDGPNPYSPDAQAALVPALMDALGVERAVLIGHSAGGATALDVALRYPDRVQALVLVDAAIYTRGGLPSFLRPLLSSAPVRRVGPLAGRLFKRVGMSIAERSWEDPQKLTPEILEGYTRPLEVEGWDRALWELVLATTPPDFANQLHEVVVPVLVITGDNDRVVPPADSVRLADELPNAQLVIIEGAGHVPHEEQPEAFLQAVQGFLAGLE